MCNSSEKKKSLENDFLGIGNISSKSMANVTKVELDLSLLIWKLSTNSQLPMGTNCAPLLADIFLYSYEAESIQSLISTGKKKLASEFNFTYRYIDDVLSINNPDFENYLGQIYLNVA